MKIEIMDTTLRDGEQTSGVSFTPPEKKHIAKQLIEYLNVDRIEVASARVSEGEFIGVKNIVEWATRHDCLDRIEVLGFIDGKQSLDWINKAGAKVINLLTKGSLKHLEGQLRKTPEQHLSDIKQSLDYAEKLGIKANIYLEDWSNGMRNSRDYVLYMLDNLRNTNLVRFMLPDTLGILSPDETYEYCKLIVDRYPDLHFDFHAHNDYDVAVANVLSAGRAGVKGVHTTINGLGERAGNAPMASVIAVLKDHLNAEMNINETKINKVSRLVESFSTIRIPNNKPVVGSSVFTQTSGVHADGDNKKNLYHNDLLPERFGRVREYALGKTSGKANILKNLEELGIELDTESMRKVTTSIIELGDRKENVTREDLPYIIADVLHNSSLKDKIKIKNFSLNLVYNLKAVGTLSIIINGEEYEETAVGDGLYDAFMNATRQIYKKLDREIPRLVDYIVTIPPGGKTDALVAADITWDYGKGLKTRGLDSDQNSAAIIATMKMLNIIEN